MTDEAAGTRRGGDGADPSTRAQELRATLGAIVDEAQLLSEQLVAEGREAAARANREAQDKADALLARARADAEEITAQARAAADAVRSRAEADVEEHRRRVRAEVTEQVTRQVTEQSRRDLAQVRAQSHDVIGDLEASVRILGVSLESAVTNIADMLSALESLRSHMVDAEADPDETAVVDPGTVVVQRREQPRGDEPAFGAQGPTRVPHAPSVFEQAGSTAAGEVVQRSDHPEDAVQLTATEAFLRSSQLDADHPDDPPFDRAGLGDGWTDELTAPTTPEEDRTNASATRAGPNGHRVEESDEQGKPLGWLFRSPQ